MDPTQRGRTFGQFTAAKVLLATLRLGESAPDTVRLADRHGVVEALRSNRADPADRLRSQLSTFSLFFAFGDIRGKEQMGVASAAGCNRLPRTIECYHNGCPPRVRRPSPGNVGTVHQGRQENSDSTPDFFATFFALLRARLEDQSAVSRPVRRQAQSRQHR